MKPAHECCNYFCKKILPGYTQKLFYWYFSLLCCPERGKWPSEMQRFKIANGEFPVGAQVHFECNRGYDLDGPTSSTCNISGLWSNQPPTCDQGNILKEVTCYRTYVMIANVLIFSSKYVLKKWHCLCLKLQILYFQMCSSGLKFWKCKINGLYVTTFLNEFFTHCLLSVWTCFLPLILLQLIFLPVIYKIFCADILCNQYTKFLKIFPTVLCQTLDTPSNGDVDYSNDPVNGGYTVDTVATFSCNFGYRREGSSSRTCQPSGHWNKQNPTCNRSKDWGITWVACKSDLVQTEFNWNHFHLRLN